MYSQKLVTTVKVGNKVLREDGDTVMLPFGSEYSLFFKNLHSTRASIRIWIDGQDATDGSELILGPNESLNLERFIKNNNLARGNRFKFLERTAGVEAHRGARVDDGIIRIVHQFERQKPAPIYAPVVYPNWYTQPTPWYGPRLVGSLPDVVGVAYASTGDVARGTTFADSTVTTTASVGSNVVRSMSKDARLMNSTMGQANVVAQAASAPGFTAPGSVSNQQFSNCAPLDLEPAEFSTVLRLVGEVLVQAAPIKVTQPITVKSRVTCSSCGKTTVATDKFCSVCGTGLEIF